MVLAGSAWTECDFDRATTPIIMALCDSATDADSMHGFACHPSIEYVAWKTRASPATIFRAMTRLVEMGVLIPRGHVGGHTNYLIDLTKAPRKAPWRPERGRRERAEAAPEAEAEAPEPARDDAISQNERLSKVSQNESRDLSKRETRPLKMRDSCSHFESRKRRSERPSQQARSGPVAATRARGTFLWNNHSEQSYGTDARARARDIHTSQKRKTEAEAEAEGRPPPVAPAPPAALDLASLEPEPGSLHHFSVVWKRGPQARALIERYHFPPWVGASLLPHYREWCEREGIACHV